MGIPAGTIYLVLCDIEDHPGSGPAMISYRLGLPLQVVKRAIKEMRARGLLRHDQER